MDNMRIGNFIKKLRNELGLSQGELAEKVYITRKAISKWENGKSIPTYDSLLTLASLFNVSIDELLLGERKNDKINKEEIIKSVYDDNISITNKFQKKTKILITVIASLVILFFTFLMYYFFNSYDSVKVYLVKTDDSEVILTDGFLVLTNEKIYFRLGNIIYRNKEKITNIKVYYDYKNINHLLYSTDRIEDTLIVDYPGYNEYFKINKKNMQLDNLYMTLTEEGVEKTVKLNLENDYSNNHLFFRKIREVSDGKKIINKKSTDENAEFKKIIKERFEFKGDKTYNYIIKEKNMEYNFIFYEEDPSRLYIDMKENNLNYVYNIMIDDNEVLYYVFDENKQIDGDIFKLDLEKEETTEQERRLFHLIKKIK